MIVAVVGSRSFKDLNYMIEVLEPYIDKIDTMISGGAKGADTMAGLAQAHFSFEYDIDFEEFPAKWDDIEGKPKHQIGEGKYGKYWKLAGYKRNTKMAEKCDCCIAFWNGKSSGTAHMIRECKRLNKPVKIIKI